MAGPYQQPAQYPPQPHAYPTYPTHPAPPKKPAFSKLVSNETVGVLIALGVLLLFLGLVIIHASPMVTNYGSNPPEELTKIQDDGAFQATLLVIGDILVDLGVAALVATLLIFGALREDLGDKGRGGVFVAAALIVIARVLLLVYSSMMASMIGALTGFTGGYP
ncbi:MAG: hypothetical protein AB1665_05955 [Candidatus Thermoplasmatota archaeon]